MAERELEVVTGKVTEIIKEKWQVVIEGKRYKFKKDVTDLYNSLSVGDIVTLKFNVAVKDDMTTRWVQSGTKDGESSPGQSQDRPKSTGQANGYSRDDYWEKKFKHEVEIQHPQIRREWAVNAAIAYWSGVKKDIGLEGTEEAIQETALKFERFVVDGQLKGSVADPKKVVEKAVKQATEGKEFEDEKEKMARYDWTNDIPAEGEPRKVFAEASIQRLKQFCLAEFGIDTTGLLDFAKQGIKGIAKKDVPEETTLADMVLQPVMRQCLNIAFFRKNGKLLFQPPVK